MMIKPNFHYNDLPGDVLIELDPNFCKELCETAINFYGNKTKSNLGKILNISGWKSRRLWNSENRYSVELFEKLRSSCLSLESDKFSIENFEKNILSIGLHSDNKSRIRNPRLPFDIKDLVYVLAHLFFDGCVSKKSSYLMAPEQELLDYHTTRLKKFGDISLIFYGKEKQLYIPRILSYIIEKIFCVNSFKSLEATIPFELKKIAIDNKEIANEIIKAAITDEGWVEDKISFALSNEKLCRDIWEITKPHYKVGRFPEKPRVRLGITGKESSEWRWIILSESMKDFYENVKLPLSHKQERIEFAVKRQQRGWYKRKPMETKRLLVKSLLEKPKSIKELSFELNVRTTSILNLINGIHCPTQNTNGLKDLGLVGILEYRRNPKGERTGKFPIYYVIDKNKVEDFIKNK